LGAARSPLFTNASKICLGGARQLLGNGGLDALAIISRDAFAETVKTLENIQPQPGAVIREALFKLSLGEADKHGDMLMSRLAVDAHGLRDDAPPAHVASVTELARAEAGLANTRPALPAEKHGL
jgi:hypothetical protein